MTTSIFIDGAEGTTGLQIRIRLEGRDDISLLTLSDSDRKDSDKRRAMLNACDIAILCLPDAAAIDAVAMIDNPDVRVIDASTAHRTADGWDYGFPEMDPGHAAIQTGCEYGMLCCRVDCDAASLDQRWCYSCRLAHFDQCGVGIFRRRQENDRWL